MDFKKILILSVSSGAGHVRAADALVKAFQSSYRAQEIVHLDTLQYTSKAVKTLYSRAYFDMARSAPEVLGWMYGMLDKPWKNEKKMRALERINVALFMRLLRRIQPDLVVNTHFLPADIISYLRKKEQLTCRSAVVITDFDAHALWLSRDVDQYCTACEEESVYLRQLGIDDSRIHTTGIPIDPVFAMHKSQIEMRRKYGLDEMTPVLLLSAGGVSVATMSSMLKALSEVVSPVQVVVICGNNADLKKCVEEFAATNNSAMKLHALGFTTQMDEYMTAADIIVGKPGGLTSSEALAKGLAFVVLNPIPGQEERNSDYLLENGAALKCNNLPTLSYKIEMLLKNPDRLHGMQQQAARIARPHAARSVVEALCND